MKKINWFYCALIALTALLAFGCSAGQQENVSTAEQAITTTCSVDADCTGGVAPKCGILASGKCVSAGLGGVHACNYSMIWPGTSTCQCVEGDIQSCKTGAYPTLYDGIQTCVVTSSSPVTTSWGTCATASPTFYGETSPTGAVRNCSGTFDCDDATDRPACADWDNLGCQSPTGAHPWQCLWRRADQPGCDCIQWDVRACTIYGGGAGHQQCNLWGATAANDWGYRAYWNACQ